MKPFDTAFLQSLRDLHPPHSVAEKLGLAVRSKRIFCPKCQAQGGSTADLAIYADHLHCFKCGWHPDVFGLVQELKGIGFREAVAWLSQEALPERAPKKSGTGSPSKDFARTFCQSQALAHRHRDEVDAYLGTRGFSFDVLKRYIGYLPDENWVGRRGGGSRLVFPHYAFADARLIPNLYGRAITAGDHGMRHDHGAAPRGFWSPTPVKARMSSRLVLTEGVFDALGLMAMGSSSPIITLFGSQGFRFEKFPLLQDLTIAFDQDSTGREKAHELLERGRERGLRIRLMPEDVYDGEKDLGEAWLARSG
jgi:ribosomal protein S27AE